MPCTLERAWSVADATRNTVKLLPGTHTLTSNLVFPGGFNLNLRGDAKIVGQLELAANSAAASSLRLQNLRVDGFVICGSDSLASVPTLDIEGSTLTSNTGGDTLAASRCILNMRRSKVIRTEPSATAIRIRGSGGSGGQVATIENSVIEQVVGANNPAIAVTDFASVQISNSTIRGGSAIDGALGFGANVTAGKLRFSTIYNSFLKCPTGNTLVSSNSNIFLYEAASPPANVVSGTACVHSHVLAKPQGTAPNGANNLVNVDPRFVNAAAGDFHLVAGSPAIDAADPAATESTDLDGTARPQGAGRDIGAFEYH